MGVPGVPRGAVILPPVPPPIPPPPVTATLPPTRNGRNRQSLMTSVSPASYGQRLAQCQNYGSVKWCLANNLIYGFHFLLFWKQVRGGMPGTTIWIHLHRGGPVSGINVCSPVQATLCHLRTCPILTMRLQPQQQQTLPEEMGVQCGKQVWIRLDPV